MADVTLPQLGETVTEGTITQWFKKVGDAVAADEPLFEVSTDKVDTEVPSPVAGVLSEIRVPEGDTVEVGIIVAVVSDGAAAPAEAPATAPEPAPRPEPMVEPTVSASPMAAPVAEPAPAPAAAEPAPAAAEPAPVAAEPAPVAAEPAAAPGDSRLLSPVVRRLVNEHGLDADQIVGTGPGGRITREDVLDHIDATASRPVAAARACTGPRCTGPRCTGRRCTGRRSGCGRSCACRCSDARGG